jgi:pilus assembly protein Flp/PilA
LITPANSRQARVVRRSAKTDFPPNLAMQIYTTLGYERYGSKGECYQPKSQIEAELRDIFLKFLSDESGATAIEYGLIAAGIALAIIAIVNTLGGTINTEFTSINSSMK